MPLKKQSQAQVVSNPDLNPPGPSEVHLLIIETALAIRIPPDQIIPRKYQVAVANICNEEFTLLFSFPKPAWEGVPQKSREAWKAFYQQFVCDWTAFPKFVPGHERGAYLYCTAGSIQLNQTVLMGCGMACVACTTECATGKQQCVTLGHMGTRNSKMLLTTGFGLCNMCSKFHVDDAPVERPPVERPHEWNCNSFTTMGLQS